MSRVGRSLLGFIPTILLLVMGTALIDTEKGLPAWVRLERDRRETEARIAELERSLAAIERQKQALQGEGFAVERAIRRELKLALPGEVIVIVEPSDTRELSLP